MAEDILKLLPCIYLVDDDNVSLSGSLVSAVSDKYKVSVINPTQIDPRDPNSLKYWVSRGITQHDYIILDLNLKNFSDITEQAIKYRGHDILHQLANAAEKKYEGLEALLNTADHQGTPIIVATSLQGEVDIKTLNPEIALVQYLRVYGMQKGVDATGKVVGYGTGVRAVIDDIEAGRAIQLNE